MITITTISSATHQIINYSQNYAINKKLTPYHGLYLDHVCPEIVIYQSVIHLLELLQLLLEHPAVPLQIEA